MPARFDGKVALVIGGSSGVGRATARGLLAEGGHVVIAARGAARLATVGQELLAARPGRVAWVSGDIAELEETERFVAATMTRFGRLDILVTSSVFNYTRAIVDTSVADINPAAPFAGERHEPFEPAVTARSSRRSTCWPRR